jgi:hypothetical protein
MASKVKVTLVTHSDLPLESVYSIWEASKNEKPFIAPREVKETVDPGEVRKLFREVIKQRIPVGESLQFVFMIEGVSVSWREQAVRHRIGVKPSPERLGVDIGMLDVTQIPDLADSVFWSQSMRIQDMSQFANQGNYRVPETLEAHADSEALLAEYHALMKNIQDGYAKLVAAGVPMEDARELMPLGATHRISWALNISSLQHIVSKRGCWILQLGIWGPVIEGMIRELVEKVDPIFGELVTPPCLKEDEFKGCVYMEENRRRYTGDDALPPCPLHVVHHHILPTLQAEGVPHATLAMAKTLAKDPESLQTYNVPRAAEMLSRAESYRKFWGRDPYNGKRLNVIQ